MAGRAELDRLPRLRCADGDTDTAGSYRVEVEVEWPDGKKQTFPGGDYGTLSILPDLG